MLESKERLIKIDQYEKHKIMSLRDLHNKRNRS